MSKRQVPDRMFSGCPETAREQRIAETAETVRAAMTAEGTSSAIVAAWIGLSESDLKRCVSPTSGRLLSLADTAGLPPAVLRRVIAWIADSMGCAIVDLPEKASSCSDLHLVARAQRESSEAIAAGLDALADGHVTRAEGVELERECDEAITHLLEIRELARLAQREGVVGIRRMDA